MIIILCFILQRNIVKDMAWQEVITPDLEGEPVCWGYE